MATWIYDACPNPSCGSSDAFGYKEGDEWGYCFSCGESSKINNEGKAVPKMIKAASIDLDVIEALPIRGFKERNITKKVAEHYGVRVAYVDSDSMTIAKHYYPYTKNGKV